MTERQDKSSMNRHQALVVADEDPKRTLGIAKAFLEPAV
jgi:hypothetical protein